MDPETNCLDTHGSNRPGTTKVFTFATKKRTGKTFDNQQSQTRAKLLFESITSASGEQVKNTTT